MPLRLSPGERPHVNNCGDAQVPGDIQRGKNIHAEIAQENSAQRRGQEQVQGNHAVAAIDGGRARVHGFKHEGQRSHHVLDPDDQRKSPENAQSLHQRNQP